MNNFYKSLSFVLLFVVFIINIVGGYIFYTTPIPPRFLPTPKIKHSYVGSDFPEDFHIPHWPAVQMTVENTIHYNPNSTTSMQEWMTLLPKGEGFVRFHNGKHYRAFGLSMYHQLHCLSQLSRATVEPAPDLKHLHHCLNYIRQVTLCIPDLTLEPVVLTGRAEDGHEGMIGVNGLGVTHTCRDWKYLFEEVERHHERWEQAEAEGKILDDSRS